MTAIAEAYASQTAALAAADTDEYCGHGFDDPEYGWLRLLIDECPACSQPATCAHCEAEIDRDERFCSRNCRRDFIAERRTELQASA